MDWDDGILMTSGNLINTGTNKKTKKKKSIKRSNKTTTSVSNFFLFGNIRVSPNVERQIKKYLV